MPSSALYLKMPTRKNTLKQGKFVVIEGTDGSGKTTQLALLKDYIEGELKKTTFTLDFPQYNEFWGKLAGRYFAGEFGGLNDTSPYLVSLPLVLDQATMSKSIKEALSAGKFVLSNRYITASLVHQTAKFTAQKDKDNYQSWLLEAGYNKLGMIKEDLVVALYVNPEISYANAHKTRARKTYGTKDIAEDDLDHQKKSAQQLVDNCAKFPHWKLIDCCNNKGEILPIEEIQELIRAIIRRELL